MSLLKSQRWLHFLMLGTAIFAVDQVWSGYQQREVDCPDRTEIQRVLQSWQGQIGRPPDDQQRQRLVQEIIDQRIVVREAMGQGLARRDPVVISQLQRDAAFLGVEGGPDAQLSAALQLGLAESDESIRRRLQHLIMAQSRSAAMASMPSAADLKARFSGQEISEALPVNLRFDFEQRYFPHHQALEAERAKRALNDGRTAGSGASFIFGEHFPSLSAVEVADQFGADVAALLQKTTRLNYWHGPVPSPYGLHLLKLNSRQASAVDAEVERWREAYIRQRWQRDMASLRGRYRVNCDG